MPQRWESDKQGNIILDSAWLEERFTLFENFCMPSMVAQTCKDFEWWVIFDENTDPYYKTRIQDIQLKFKNFKPKFERSYDTFEANLPIKLQNSLIRERINWLITTRLDNDDMLAKDTIKVLQKGFDFKTESLLEIPWGYTLELNSVPKPKLRRVRMELNPFISYAEEVKIDSAIKTVYFNQHTEWGDVKSIIISNKAHWVQIIHEKNLFNRISGELVSPMNFNSRFSFNTKVLKIKPDYKLLTKQLMEFFKLRLISLQVIKIKSFLNEKNSKKN